MSQKSVFAGILFLLVSIVSSVGVDICFRFLKDVSASLSVFDRFFFSGVIGLFIVRKNLPHMLLASHKLQHFFRAFAMVFIGFFSALSLAYVPLSTFALFLQVIPIVSTLFGALILKDAFPKIQKVSLVISFIGAIIALGLDNSQGLTFFAILFPICDILIESTYNLLSRFLGKHHLSLQTQSAFFFTFSMLVALFFIPFITWHPLTFLEVSALIFLPLLTLLQQFFWMKSLLVISISTAAPFLYLFLPLSSFFGYLIFGEVISTTFIVGGSLILFAGVLTLNHLKQEGGQQNG